MRVFFSATTALILTFFLFSCGNRSADTAAEGETLPVTAPQREDFSGRADAAIEQYVQLIQRQDSVQLAVMLTEADIIYPVGYARELIINYDVVFDYLENLSFELLDQPSHEHFIYRVSDGSNQYQDVHVYFSNGTLLIRDSLAPLPPG